LLQLAYYNETVKDGVNPANNIKGIRILALNNRHVKVICGTVNSLLRSKCSIQGRKSLEIWGF